MLREFQAAMRSALLTPDAPIPLQVQGGRIPALHRFAIYRNNVLGSLAESLKAAYPVTHRLAGEDAFRRAALSYVMAHPPKAPQLLAYGASFPEFLSRLPLFRARPCLGDMARLELAFNTAYFAADAPALDAAALRAVPTCRYPAIRLVLHPSAHLLAMCHPVLGIWKAVHDGGDCPSDPERGPERILIVRPRVGVQCKALSAGELTLLLSFAAGAPLAQAAAVAGGTEPGLDLQQVLFAHLEFGTFAGFSLDDVTEES